jgi:hypothetical protein
VDIFQYSQKQTNKHRLFVLLLISMLMALSTAYAQPPAAATLTSPSGSLGSDSPTYTWNAVSNVSWYFLWVDDSSGNAIKQWYRASEAGCASGHGTCSVVPGTTLNHGAGRWWIQTWNADGYGSWSNVMSFAVGASLGSAALVAPQGDITVATPKYSWNAVASASWYYLWVNDSSGNVIKQWYRASEVGCGSGSGTCSMTHATALNQGAGQWWVQTWNAASGYGPWSSAMSFDVNESDSNDIILHGGKPDNSGEGDYYPWDDADAIRGLVFDAHKPFVLKSVKVYNQAGQAATRTFTLYDGSNNEIAHKTVAVPENESRIQLNMAIPAGHGYKLMADVHKGLYRNNNVSYPIRIGDAVTITGSDINRSHYYFFYDWEIAVKDSPDKPVNGNRKGYYPGDKEINYSNVKHANPSDFCSVINAAPPQTTIILEDGHYNGECTLKDVSHVTIKANTKGGVKFNSNGYFFELNHCSYMNIIGMDVQGGKGSPDAGIAKIYGYGKSAMTHHIYIADNVIHDAGGAVFTSPDSHDITVDRNVIYNISPNYGWYMLGYHLTFSNNLIHHIGNNFVAIRGYYPLNSDVPWYEAENQDMRGSEWERLGANDWTHLIVNNTFGMGLDGGVNRSGNRGAGIGFFIGWNSGVDSENGYQPPQNVVIENNLFYGQTSDRGVLGSIIIVSNYGFPQGADGSSYIKDGKAVVRGTIIRNNISDAPLFRLENGDDPNMSLITLEDNHDNLGGNNVRDMLVNPGNGSYLPKKDAALIIDKSAANGNYQPYDIVNNLRDGDPDIGAYEVR